MKHLLHNDRLSVVLLSISLFFASCSHNQQESKKEVKKVNDTTMTVTATAYNSIESQTKKGNIGLAAWGDTLKPGMKTIAVSRDLIKLGLDHNEEVHIECLEGTYTVKDKMNKRWTKKIDIYMGLDAKAAREWGKKQVDIKFEKKDDPKDKFSKQAKKTK
ncbi:MAG: 3D domain-containing protein [Psychroflexus sp.]